MTLRRFRPTPSRLVHHVLENPALVAAVRELPGPVLGRWVDAVGLESAGDIVGLATTAQLERLFDEDLWRSDDERGDEPKFDSRRFAIWLDVLLESGEAAVVERLCELPFDFVTLAINQLLLVIDIDELGIELSDGARDLDSLEKALESSLYEEWEEFRMIARDSAAWDSLLVALLALDRDHHDLLRRILERCCAISREFIDDNGGLYEVLTSDEMLESDARAERDDRRAAEGYVAESDARAFLELARRGLGDPRERDAITRAYFRELSRSKKASLQKPPAEADLAGLLRLLARARVIDRDQARSPRPKALGKPSRAPSSTRSTRESSVERAMTTLRAQNSVVYAQRLDELSYLANVLIAGSSRDGRRLRPVEALEVAVAICDFGLTLSVGAAPVDSDADEPASRTLTERPLDLLFRDGWCAIQSGAECQALGASLRWLLDKPR
jgi:hypothetical protein